MRILRLTIAATALLVFALNTSCSKESFMNEGIITGFDSRTSCGCCKGLWINFKGQTQPGGGFYLIKNDPVDLGIDANTTFPVYIDIDWTPAKDPALLICSNSNMITVTKYKKH